MLTPIAQSQIGSVAVLNQNAKNGAKVAETPKPESRVEEIKAGLEQGTYKFQLEKTAEKVAEALI